MTHATPDHAARTPALRMEPSRDTTLRVLVVDDDEPVGHAVTRMLKASGYSAHFTTSGAEAVDVLRSTRFDAMLCDVRMPGMDGLQVLDRALHIDPAMVVLMLTGVNDAAVATSALTRGAVDYLVKPLGSSDIERAMSRAIHMREVRTEEQRIARLITHEVDRRTAAVSTELAALRGMAVGVVDALVNAMETKDVFLLGHSQRVAELSASVAVQLGLGESLVEQVRLAGRLHEVGKIGVRESVLHKQGQLTAEEWAHVREYVRIGVEILTPMGFLGDTVRFVREHHERWDGTGYPSGLAGHSISMGGRILAAADAYDAVTSNRPYRQPMSQSDALTHLARLAGSQFDPVVFDALRTVVERRKALPFLDLATGMDIPRAS